MRKCYYLVLFLFFTGFYTQAQDEYEYTPFPDSNAIWSEYYEPPLGSGEDPYYHALALFNEDTVINSITYHKLFRLYDTVLNRKKAEYIGGIREDSAKRVYFKGTPIDYLMPDDNALNENDEILLYDFSLEEGDTIKFGNETSFFLLAVENIDTLFVNGGARKRYYFSQYPWSSWIEGVGNIRGLLFTSGDLPTNGVGNTLICFKRDGKQEYFNDQFSECFPGMLASAIGEVNEQSARVFPNPATESVYFEHAGDYERVCIYNLNGKQLIQQPVSDRERISVSVSAFPPGMYFYKLIGSSGQTKTGKFIVK